MSSLRASALAGFIAFGVAVACGVNEVDYEGKRCPCPAGYRCDHQTNRCTTRASTGGASGSASGGAGGTSGTGGLDGAGMDGGGSDTGGGESGGSGNATGSGGSGNSSGSGSGGTGKASGGTGGAGIGGTGAVGNEPWNCAPPDACDALPNGGLGLVWVDAQGDFMTDCSKNCVGIFVGAAAHTYGDAEITLDYATGDLCLRGSVHGDSYVEVDIGFGRYSVSDPTHAIRGFEFTVEGNDVPDTLQFGYYMLEDWMQPRCVDLEPAAGAHAVPFGDVHLLCSTAMDIGPLAFDELMNAAIYLSSNGGDLSFDFCLANLAALR